MRAKVCFASSRYQVSNEGERARILTLPDPEQGLVAHLAIRIVLRDVDQFVEGFTIAPLGEHESVMSA
jgi:hypothetical protein